MIAPRLIVFLALGLLQLAAEGSAFAKTDSEGDLAAARALFEANLDAIRQRDREAYLACYLESETLARSGPGGMQLGFEDLAASAGEGWPDHFDAQDLQLVPVRPGVVYGAYRYRVRYGDQESIGLSERVFLDTPKGWRIAVTTAFAEPPATPPPPWVLTGATLVDGTGAPPLKDIVIVVENGRIGCIGRRGECKLPAGGQTLDLSGHWITPGVVDAHVHFSQTGWADGRPDSIDVRARYPYEAVQAALSAQPERFFRAYLCSGVTAVFDVGGYPWTWELPARAEPDTRAPRVAAAGPLLSTLDFWLNLPAERQFIYLADEEAARQGVGYLAAHGADAIKVWLIPARNRLETEMDATVMAAGEEARKRGVPLIVHATGLREAKVALRTGAHLLVHSVWDQEVDEELIRLIRESDTIYNPTLTVPAGYLRMAAAAATGTVPEIDDPNGCVDAETRRKVAETTTLGEELGAERASPESLTRRREALAERERIGARNLQRLHAAGVEIAMGTDAGNPLTLHGPSVYAEMEAMQAAGLTPMEVLVAATRGSARAMGRGDEIGTVEAGKLADLLVLTADPTADIRNMRALKWVMRGGELRPMAELRAAVPEVGGP